MSQEVVLGVILARLDSSRLNGKVLLPLGDRPVIGHVINRARRISRLSKLAVATSERASDDPLVRYAGGVGVDVVRGATDDVAGRLLRAAEASAADLVVRLNADSPFLDPGLIDDGIALARARPDAAIISNVQDRSYPYGISVEVIRTQDLAKAYPAMSDNEREHVTRHLYAHQETFRIVPMPSGAEGYEQARLVVDTEADLRRAENVLSALGSAGDTAGYEQTAATWLATGATR